MAESIGQVVSLSLSNFKSLLALGDGGGWEAGEVETFKVRDELARLKVWAGNIGAHQTGRSSLEYRLRDASHIRHQVVRLLKELGELIEDARSILQGERVPWDKMPPDDDDDSETSMSEDDVNDNTDETDFIPPTELAQILRNISDTTNSLLRLSVAIRNPAPHDRFRASKSTDTSHYEPYDIQHVQTKFPDMDRTISERLGRANSRRRQYFKYRESHHAKLARGLDIDTSKTEVGPPQSTVASSILDAVKQDMSFDVDAAVVDEDGASEAGGSQTSFATSAAGSSTDNKLRVPPLPAGARRGPFECPFCYVMITATTTRSWKKHVYRDLRPYVCLNRDCEVPDQDFGRRRQWMDHVLQHHWKTWPCPKPGCSEAFDSAVRCQAHMANAHPEAASLPFYGRPTTDLPQQKVKCPVCGHAVTSIKQYQRHVGHHQEQLALFSLPVADIQEEDGDDDDDSGKSENEGSSESLAPSELLQPGTLDQPDADVMPLTEPPTPTSDPSGGDDFQIWPPSREMVGGASATGDRSAASSDRRRGSGSSSWSNWRWLVSQVQREEGDTAPDKTPLPASSSHLLQERLAQRDLKPNASPEQDSGESTVPRGDTEREPSIAPDAQWTQIPRSLVDPEALSIGKERFEILSNDIVVFRTLSTEEIEAYTAATIWLRETRGQGARTEISVENTAPPATGGSAEPATATIAAERIAPTPPHASPRSRPPSRPLSRSRERRSSPPPVIINNYNTEHSDDESESGHGAMARRPALEREKEYNNQAELDRAKRELDEIRYREDREKAEREYMRRLREDLVRSGVDERGIKVILEKEEKKRTKAAVEIGTQPQPQRPMYTRMPRRHLSIETLNFYHVDFELDQDPNYVLVKRWVPEEEQESWWKHTKTIRERRKVVLEIEADSGRHDGQVEGK